MVQCNCCGRGLCAACDHRIKGFPYCQDCIVAGVDLLRQHSRSSYIPFVSKRTSPVLATLFSLICPGLGAAYNGQTVKALVYFGIFIGLFQMAVLAGGAPIFVFGFLGMWLFAALDSWRTAQQIRSGLTPDVAEDIFVKRFSGNPELWGIVMLAIAGMFILQSVFHFRGLMRGLLPIMLIVMGVYVLRGYVFGKKDAAPVMPDLDSVQPARLFGPSNSGPRDRVTQPDLSSETWARGRWQDRG